MKGLKVLLVMLLVGCIASGVYAKPAEVYLMPTSIGEPSKMMPVGDKATADLWLEYIQGGAPNFVLTGLADVETVGVFFQPPAGCTLLAIEATAMAYMDPAQNTFKMFAALSDPALTADAWKEYHGASATPGPSPIEEIIEGPTLYTGISDADWTIDTLWVSSTPDVEENPFFGGWIKAPGDSSPNPYIYANATEAPYHALMWRSAPASETPGWYSSWHIFRVRALVRIYENIGPMFTLEPLLGTYYTGNRAVGIYTEDFGPAAPGIAEIHLYYSVDGGDAQEVTVVQDSVDATTPNFEYAWWHAEIPGQAAGSVVTYCVEGVDSEGADASSAEYSYMIGAGTPGNGLLYVEEDEAWSIMDIHNAYTGHPWDLWYEYFGGVADSTVTDYYITGAGAHAISWLTFSGYIFAEWSFDEAFRNFMDAGGCLFLAGQDVPGGGYGLGYGEWIVESPHPLADYLKVYGGTDDYIADDPFSVFVDNTDVLTTGMPDEVEVSCGSIYQSTWVGIFTDLDAGCVPLFFDAEGNILGYRYEAPGGFKVVHLYFNFHAMTDTDAQDTFISNLTDWFAVGVEENPEELVYNLPMVSPNPLSRSTAINFSIGKSEYVSVKVYDVTGSLVSNLVDEKLTAGTHTLTINTESLTSGVYFLKMDAGTFSGTRKFVVMK